MDIWILLILIGVLLYTPSMIGDVRCLRIVSKATKKLERTRMSEMGADENDMEQCADAHFKIWLEYPIYSFGKSLENRYIAEMALKTSILAFYISIVNMVYNVLSNNTFYIL